MPTFKINISQKTSMFHLKTPIFHITLGMNGAAVPRHGLILSQDGATHSRKVSRYLPGLRDVLKTSTNIGKVKNPKNRKFDVLIP